MYRSVPIDAPVDAAVRARRYVELGYRRLRDFAVDMDLGVTIEDTGGADIDTAATAHLMLSTSEQSRLHTVDFMNWVTVSNGAGMPPTGDGVMGAPVEAGLGLAVDPGAFGAPLGEHAA